jgi:hypothetical protein
MFYALAARRTSRSAISPVRPLAQKLLKDLRSRASLRAERESYEDQTRSKRLLGLFVVCGFAAVLVGSPAALATPKCFGQEATIGGTSGPDRIVGIAGPDVIVGGGRRCLVEFNRDSTGDLARCQIVPPYRLELPPEQPSDDGP